ncbi:MAG: hypothetical protein GF331_02890, partial [Chitinivibrionales bacterium]|nr:hypothetical protein [Chitinivibrionales bacterium]
MKYAVSALIGAVLVVVALVSGGCGVSDGKLATIDSRIDSLSQMGVPDSILTEPKIQLAEARGYKKAANMAQAARCADSATLLLDQAQQWYDQQMEKLRPEIASVKKAINEEKEKLSGPNLREADSLIAVADSFAAMDWLFQARQKLAVLEEMMPVLLESEKTGEKLRPKIVGSWREVVRPDGIGSTSVLKTTYTFNRDGSMTFSESKKGQSNETLKEDWAFTSWGNWEMKGDTVLLNVEREKCHKQVYETLVAKDGKPSWKRSEGPAYDSTFT